MEKVDKLDLKILSIISGNARVPFKDVAAVCGVSRAAIHQRVQRLVENGVITGSGFTVNPKSVGFSTCTYVGISLARGSMYREVAEQLEKIPEIVECHYTTGNYMMLVKLYCHDNEDLMQLLNGKIQSIEGVTATETLISLEQTVSRNFPIPGARRGNASRDAVRKTPLIDVLRRRSSRALHVSYHWCVSPDRHQV